MSMIKNQIKEELQRLVPLATKQLQMMLEDPRTSPALRKQLIEMALRYGLHKPRSSTENS